MNTQRMIAKSVYLGEFTMRAIIILMLCSSILISSSPISQSTSQKDFSEDSGLSENIEQRESNGIVREVRENRNEPADTVALYQQDDNDKEIQEISTHAHNEKRQVSVTSAASSSVSSSSAGQSVFVAKTNDICTKILGELKALTEYAKIALLNLKSELSLGPQKGENYEENVDATSESLAITQNEIYSFVDRFPTLVQAVIDEPSEIWTVQDILTASIPADQISGSVGNLHGHILELLQVIREWLTVNQSASSSIQSVENSIASLESRRFEILDDLVVHENSNKDYSSSSSSASATVYPGQLSNCEGSSSSSAAASSTSASAVSYSNSQQSSTIAESGSRTGVLDSSKTDLVVVEKFKTLRALCNAIRKIPDLLIELLLALKEGLSSLHTNDGLCGKIKDHPIFSILGFHSLLPKDGNQPPNAIARSSPGDEYESEVQSTSASSTSSASSSTSSTIDYKIGEETTNSGAAMGTADQTIHNSSPSVISPWVRDSTGSTSSASSSISLSSLCGSGNDAPRRAFSSAVATASSADNTSPNTASSLIPSGLQGSTTSASSTLNSLSSSLSSDFEYGSRQGVGSLNSAIARASSVTQTLPDRARAVISPWLQGSTASASSTSTAMSSSGLSDEEYRGRSGVGALSSAVATASSAAQTIPDKTRSLISPWVQSSETSSSASSSATSSSSFGLGNENMPVREVISSAVASATSAAQTLPDTARAAISPWIQSSKASSSASSSATSSNSYGFGNGNLPRTGVMSSVVASASSVAQTLPDTARSVISPWIERSKDSSSLYSGGTSSSDLYGSGNGNGLKTKATNSAKATASSVAQVFRNTAGSAIHPWIRKAHDSGSSASSTAFSSSSSSDDESRSEVYSSTVTGATSVGETFVNSPKIQGTTGSTSSISNSAQSSSSSTHGDVAELGINSQRQPCSKCGLFSCLCNQKGHGQHFHSLGRSSATDNSMISSSKESDQPHFVSIPSASYSSSSASSASSSSSSEKQRISQQRNIPGESITSNSASSASATSSSSLDRSNCNDALNSHQQFSSASAAATASAQSSSNTNLPIYPPIQRSQDSSLSPSSSRSSSVFNPSSPSNSRSGIFSGEEASHKGHCLSSLLGTVKSSCPLCKNTDQSPSLVERCSKCGLFPCLCKHRTQNLDHSSSSSLENSFSSSEANSKAGHSYFPLPSATISSSTATSSASSSSMSQDQEYSPTITIPSESFASASATSSNKVSQGQQFSPAMTSLIGCSSRVPLTSSNSLNRKPQLSPEITIPSESFRRPSALSSSTAYSSNANQMFPHLSPVQSGGYLSPNSRRCTSAFPNAHFQIGSPSPGSPNSPKPNKTLPHFRSSNPSSDSSSSSSSSASSTVSSTSGNYPFSSYIPNLSHFVPNFNLGSSSASSAASATSSLELSSNNPSESVSNEPSAAPTYNDDDGRSSILKPATYGFQSQPDSTRQSAPSRPASGVSSSPYHGFDLDDEYNESVSSRISPSLSPSASNIPFHQSTDFFVLRPSTIEYNGPNRRSSAFPTSAGYQHGYEYLPLKTYHISQAPRITEQYVPQSSSSQPALCINSIPFVLSGLKINSIADGSQLVPGDMIVINLGGQFSLIGKNIDNVSPVVFSLLRPTQSMVTLNNGERVFQLSNEALENDEECSGTLKRLRRCLKL